MVQKNSNYYHFCLRIIFSTKACYLNATAAWVSPLYFKKGGKNPDFPPTGQSESHGLHVQYMLGLQGHDKSDYSKVDNGNAGAEQLRITS